MLMKKPMFYVYVYVGGLSSINVIEIYHSRDKSSAYAKLENYLESHPECVKAYVDEVLE